MTRLLAEASMLIVTRPAAGGVPAPSLQLRALFRAHYVTELVDDVRSIRSYKVRPYLYPSTYVALYVWASVVPLYVFVFAQDVALVSFALALILILSLSHFRCE